jgi:lipoyl(octanoyl) transferase
MVARRPLRGVWLGRRSYGPVLDLQRRLRDAVEAGTQPPTVLLLEHEPVVTLGRGAHEENVLLPEELLAERGYSLVRTDRGGDVTLHAPGQLVAYPILPLPPERRDVRRYVRDLTEVMRRMVAEHGVAAGPVSGLIGLWVDALEPSTWAGAEAARRLAKIGAIGVRLSRWVTMHGFALNLTMDLAAFDLIVPCGISWHGVTSVEALTGIRVPVEAAAPRAHALLADAFGTEAADYSEHSTGDLDLLTPG